MISNDNFHKKNQGAYQWKLSFYKMKRFHVLKFNIYAIKHIPVIKKKDITNVPLALKISSSKTNIYCGGGGA